jgi:sialic acid synthase SpsE
MKRIKIPSPDANSWTLIDECLDCFDEVLISVGMSTDEELDRLLNYIATKQVQHKTVIMHCVSEYPAPARNMWRIKWLRDIGFRPGYSDHTLGTDAAKLAVSMGAEYVEKHLTLSRFLSGKDQAMSGTIEEFREICEWRDKVREMVRMIPIEPKNRNYIGKWSNA